jgi:hypothetical protein
MYARRSLRIGLSVLLWLVLPACQESTQPVGGHVDVAFEVISEFQLPTQIDSNLVFYRKFVEWNPNDMLDTVRADSLAAGFARLTSVITDLWFPNVLPICSMPFDTYNHAYVRFASSDTSLLSQGFSRTSSIIRGCFPTWRHYRYTHNKAG